MTSLSNSILWQRMQEYYAQLGTEVWEDEVVPQQITNNTYLANNYAKQIIAQIQDYISTHGKPLDDCPFYVLEIGAGHGRLSFYLLENLRQAFEVFGWPKKWLKFIMTDISLKSLETWQTHHALKPFIDEGWLDLAVYNANQDTQIKLAISGQLIEAKSINKPLFVICNYIFDTLSQDAFQVINHRLHEVELVIKNQAQLEKGELKDYFKDAKYEFVKHPVKTQYYTEKPLLNKILQAYEAECENAAFLMPIGAIHCIENLKKLTQGPLMFLVSDKGVTDKDLFDEDDDPDISFHGSVSMMVNFDALKRYTELCGGNCFLMGDKGADFQVANFIFQADYKIPQTAYAFANSLSCFSPQDLFDICYIEDEPVKLKTLEAIVNILNLAEWDPSIFYDYHELLIEKLENDDMTVNVQHSILNGLERAWRYFFKLEKSQDLPFAIGSTLYNMGLNEKAIEFYNYSLAYYGKDKDTYFNLTLAYHALENYEKAQEMINESLKISPKDEAIAELQKEIDPMHS
ncbi:SAM-dependent methyltransferase [Candidatus Berkiella aquae]|nr:SAM-dependent methyltransferase [Candidatus Berkiella aquae]MCS5711991.1 SAM-dependent methyltransferase [Candidatus Berkiella aquae]